MDGWFPLSSFLQSYNNILDFLIVIKIVFSEHNVIFFKSNKIVKDEIIHLTKGIQTSH